MSNVKSVQHTYIVFRLSQMHFPQTALARHCGCTPAMINQIIRGVKKSDAIQLRIAELLGFRSWGALIIEAYRFQNVVTPDFCIKEACNA